MKRGKILIVANSSWFIHNFELALIRALQSTLEVVAVTPHDDWSSRFASLGVRFVALPMSRRGLNPFADIRMALGLYRVYQREEPEVVFHNTIKPVIYGSIAARAAGVKGILNMIPGLGYVFTGQTLRHRSLRHLVKLMYRCALDGSHRVFFQNPDDRRYFVENGLVKADKAELTYGLGVDLERFQYVEPTPTTRGCTFILVSRMLWDKGVGEFVAAATELKRTFVEARFQLLGKLDQDNPSHINRETIDEWHRSGVVEYLGEVSDVRPILEKADVVVLPSSYREGVPNALLEGLALGRPVITTDAPGCRETVVDKVNGLLIPPRDVAALSAAMRYMITHQERRLEMGREGRKLAVERFDVNLVNAIILRAINAS
jgi:glycosyltransferase involved in cell wall biosynthesis